MSKRKEQYFREHYDEYKALFEQSCTVETKAEMKRINKQIRKLYGRDRAVPVWERFPSNNTWMWYATIILSILSILISTARIILLVMTG